MARRLRQTCNVGVIKNETLTMLDKMRAWRDLHLTMNEADNTMVKTCDS